MLFEVKRKHNRRVYTVYSVKQGLLGSDCEFLIYESSQIGWIWIKANEFIPIEE